MNDNWRVVSLLCLVSGVAYLVRTDVAFAQERMAPALGLTMAGMSAIDVRAFQLSHALLQVPAEMFGARYGIGCLPGAAVFSLGGPIVPAALLAITALSLSCGCVNGAEAPFFTIATVIGAANPGAAAGLLHLMGNLGGVISIWPVPHMSAAWGWNGTIGFWAGVTFVSALLWLTVRVDDPAPVVSDPALRLPAT